jgi:hypothetical protein
MRIAVHIERLVVDDTLVNRGVARGLSSVVEAELMRRLAGGGLAPWLRRGGAVAGIAGGAVVLDAGSDALSLGRHVAGGIYGAIGESDGKDRTLRKEGR